MLNKSQEQPEPMKESPYRKGPHEGNTLWTLNVIDQILKDKKETTIISPRWGKVKIYYGEFMPPNKFIIEIKPNNTKDEETIITIDDNGECWEMISPDTRHIKNKVKAFFPY